MKKLSTTLFAASLSLINLSEALAEPLTKTITKGNYFGLELLRTDIKFHEDWTTNSMKYERHNRSFSDYGYGAGLNYGYAFNFNRLFVTPGIFYEKNNAKARGKGFTDTSPSANYNKIKIDERYGIKGDFGYDVSERFSPYFTTGYSRIGYKTTNTFRRNGVLLVPQTVNSTRGDWFYGAGLKFRYNDNFSLGLEYNTQIFVAKTRVSPNTASYSGTYKTKLDIAKLGVFYNF